MYDAVPLNGRMADELAKIWKEAVVTESKYYPGVYLERLRKI